MQNTEYVISLLAGRNSVVAKDTEGQIYMAKVLSSLVLSEDEKTIKVIIEEMPLDRGSYILNVVKALLLSCSEWEPIFKGLNRRAYDIRSNLSGQCQALFQNTCIATMEAVVWINSQGMLTEIKEKQFFDFLLRFFHGPNSWISSFHSDLSGRLANVSSDVVKLPNAEKLFFERLAYDKPISDGGRQIVRELCIKRIVGFSIDKMIEICAMNSVKK